MKRMKKQRFEREYGPEYQVKSPEDIIEYDIGRRMAGYELEADVYTMKMQREANEYKDLVKKIAEGAK